jgi:hypothetical protein
MTDYMQFQIKEKSDKNGQLLIPFSAKHYAVHDKILSSSLTGTDLGKKGGV